VLIGIQSYSFRDRDLQGVIDGMVATGLTSCELWEAHVEPRELRGRDTREELRRWRLGVSLDHFYSIRDRFSDAGLTLNSYNLSFKDHFSDEEIDRGFEMAKALGVAAITASAHVNSVPRIARMSARHGIPVAMHNHSVVDPNEFSSPEQFAAAMAQGDGRSITVNLDVGHFAAANHDAVVYLREHHESITTLHLKDRRRNDGPNVPWGEGDAPLEAVLHMLRDEPWDIPANIEYEYPGADTVAEVRRCVDFCRRTLEA
jgi:sugar phosphate isomerase/epimerase